MRTFLQRLSLALSWVAKLALWLAGLGLVAMTVIVSWQVYGRYVLGSTPRYAEAGAVLLMAWFIFLGAAVGVREGYHLGFDVLLHVVSRRVKQILLLISDLAVFGFGVGMVVYGWQLVQHAWRVSVPTLGVPGGLPFLPITIGGGLICVFILERVLRRAAGLAPDTHARPEAGQKVTAQAERT